jgi:hypothetical protein
VWIHISKQTDLKQTIGVGQQIDHFLMLSHLGDFKRSLLKLLHPHNHQISMQHQANSSQCSRCPWRVGLLWLGQAAQQLPTNSSLRPCEEQTAGSIPQPHSQHAAPSQQQPVLTVSLASKSALPVAWTSSSAIANEFVSATM